MTYVIIPLYHLNYRKDNVHEHLYKKRITFDQHILLAFRHRASGNAVLRGKFVAAGSGSLAVLVVTCTMQQAEKDVNEKYICFVEERPSLYISSDPLYYARIVKDLLWVVPCEIIFCKISVFADLIQHVRCCTACEISVQAALCFHSSVICFAFYSCITALKVKNCESRAKGSEGLHYS